MVRVLLGNKLKKAQTVNEQLRKNENTQRANTKAICTEIISIKLMPPHPRLINV